MKAGGEEDTLSNPGLLENDELKKFNVILANPPYSIKAWDQNTFKNDPFGRNLWGTPPQGCADFAFQQHIQKSLDQNNGRSITLWPHGILFREAEAGIPTHNIELFDAKPTFVVVSRTSFQCAPAGI